MRWNRYVLVVAVLVAQDCLAAEPENKPERYDLLIRNGRIVDGTGNPWFHGDVAIRGDRIATVGRLDPSATATEIIDARGMIVAPGFIDMHSHSDMTLLRDRNAASKIRQGVTTEVLGEGDSAGPAVGKRGAGKIDVDGQTLQWKSMADYFHVIESHRVAVNVCSYVGLGTLLECVKGESLGRPTQTELQEMSRLLEQALNEGAIGLSSMLASPSELPVTTEDLVELCQVVRRHGGLFSSHIRNEGTDVLKSVKQAIAVGEQAGVPVDVIHLKIADQSLWGRMGEIVSLIEAARRRGVNVHANVYPYTRGNNDLRSIIPPWAHDGGTSAMLSRLRDPAVRPRLKKEIREGLPGWYNHYTAVGGDWGRMLISAQLGPSNRRFQGKTMAEVVKERSAGNAGTTDPLDVLFDFLIEEGGSVSTIYAHHTEEDMNLALIQPWCSIGSDGLALAIDGPLRTGHPHPRSFGTFPRILGVYVRDRSLLRLEDAVRKMTSLNAAKIGLPDRGLLRAGHFADITVFDPARVVDRATYLEPFQYPDGIVSVLVNGEVVLRNGSPTGKYPGKPVKRAKVQ